MNKSTKPFFINLHYYSPHRPSVATSPEALAKYKQKEKDLTTGQHGKATKEMAAYGTMVENLDMNIGRLFEYLNTSGKINNTIVIFTSDNGYNKFQSTTNQLRGSKGQIYEGGIRVPLLIHWKDKLPPQIVKQNITVLDFFPTFLDIAGIKDYKGILDGDSILSLIRQPRQRSLYWHIASTYRHEPCTMMKQGDWKLIQFLNSGKTELYNLVNDPIEKNNLTKTSQAKLKELLMEMEAWRKSNNVPLPKASKLSY